MMAKLILACIPVKELIEILMTALKGFSAICLFQRSNHYAHSSTPSSLPWGQEDFLPVPKGFGPIGEKGLPAGEETPPQAVLPELENDRAVLVPVQNSFSAHEFE
jgi:hypothetical protein